MDIFFASPFFFPSLRYGGSSTATYNVLKALSRRGHKITVLTVALGDSKAPQITSRQIDGMTVHYFKGFFEGVFLSPYFLRFLVNQPKPDIVHINNYRNFPSDIASLWSQRKKIPTVVSANGCLFAHRYVPSFPFTRQILYRVHDAFISSPIRKATLALAVSSEESKHYQQFGVPIERIRLVPNGIDLEVFCPGQPKNDLVESFPSDAKLVGYVGRLDPIKGLLPLVRAFETIQKVVPESRLVLVGPDFGMKGALLSLIRQRKIQGVAFLDPVANDQLPGIYRALDVVVTPSFFEIFGMSTLEAMACGRPVVSTRVGGASEIIQGGLNGVLFEPGDDEGLATEVARVLRDREYAERIGDNARRRALHYGIDHAADLTEKAYLECVSAH